MSRMWESIICYEDRTKFHTSRWRISGIKTIKGGENTDSGILWLSLSRAGDTVTANIYKDDSLSPATLVATGAADISAVDGLPLHAAELALTAANNSAIAGSFWIQHYFTDWTCPVQVALAEDEDLDALWDGIESLSGFSPAEGMAEFIRVAGEDVLARANRLFEEQLGAGAPAAWFIKDDARTYPDLRLISNPAQLRLACAYRALAVALGRQHDRADDTAYSVLRDCFAREYENAMKSISLALHDSATATAVTRRLVRA